MARIFPHIHLPIGIQRFFRIAGLENWLHLLMSVFVLAKSVLLPLAPRSEG